MRAYAAASGDRNRIHLDPEFARSIGLPDVIAHGMLTMAFLALHVRERHPGRLVAIRVRFTAMVHVGDVVSCHTLARTDRGASTLVEIEARRQSGEVVARGEAETATAELG